jgi:hypothetical protein
VIRRADDDPDEMLATALVKARHLVSELEKESAELEADPPKDLMPEKLAQGKRAMANALASARRMLTALEEAIAIKKEADESDE